MVGTMYEASSTTETQMGSSAQVFLNATSRKVSGRCIAPERPTMDTTMAPSACPPLLSATTKSGETVSIFPSAEGLRAEVQDRRHPGLVPKVLPVHLAPGYSLSSILKGQTGQIDRDIHVLQVSHGREPGNKKIVYIGKGGLLGGGGKKSKPHSCEGYPTFMCGACGFQCPKGACEQCCIHKEHNCQERQKKAKQKKTAAQIKEIIIEAETRGQMTDHDENYDLRSNDFVNVREDAQNNIHQVPGIFDIDEELNENYDKGTNNSTKMQNRRYPSILTTSVAVSKSTYIDYIQNTALQHATRSKHAIVIWLAFFSYLVIFLFTSANIASASIARLFSSILLNANKIILYFKEQKNTKNKERDQRETNMLQNLVSYQSPDFMSKEKFRLIWQQISNTFEYEDRVIILHALIKKRIRNNLTVLDICNILRCLIGAEICDVSALSHEESFSVRDLKKSCLLKRNEALYNPELNERMHELEKEKLIDFLTDMDWGTEVCEIFFKQIVEESTADHSELFTLLRTGRPPESIVLPVFLPCNSLKSPGSRVASWTLNLLHRMLCTEILLMGLDYSQLDTIAPVLYKLLQIPCYRDSLRNIIVQQKTVIRKNSAQFVEVLKLLTNYRVKGDIGTSALSFLEKTNPREWVKTVDRHVVSKIFQGSEKHSVEELICKICEQPIFESEILQTDYNLVIKTYRSPSKMIFAMGTTYRNLKNSAISEWGVSEIKQWAELVKKGKTVSLYEKVAVLVRTAKIHHRFEPRASQILSLLVLLHPEEGKGRLLQVNTGEGKSLIVAMLAAMHALQGKTVDVITTSTELSVPEVKRQKPFFSTLCLTVSENSGKSSDESPYKSDILYGTASDFQADILRKEFQGFDCRAQRGFDIVIVDEVDSMLYDNHSSSVRLSGPIPAMNHLEIALAVIWERIHRIARHLVEHNDQTYFIPDEFETRDGSLKLESGEDWEDVALPVDDKESFIIEHTQKHINQCLRLLNESEKQAYENCKKLLNEIKQKEKQMEDPNNKENESSLKEEYQKMQEDYKALTWHNHYPVIDIPAHLREFAKNQSPYWIKNAMAAAFAYKKDFHYTVQNNRIVPIQYNETGVLQPNVVWSDGLSQFLQIKEDLPVEPESITTNFISNISFFQRYSSAIYGLTGTLGEKSTQKFLSATYNVDMVKIPPHKYNNIADNDKCEYLCKELIPIIASTADEWYDNIIAQAIFHASHHRAVLIICKFINHVKVIAKRLKSNYGSDKIITYTGEELSFDKKEVDSGQIIIATNIAGRGTDLKTSNKVEKHGGMYVMITFLPESQRVELQNAGRTAREGKKGMAQIVLHNTTGHDMETLRSFRKEHEDRINNKAIDEAKKVLMQDELFKRFCILQSSYLPSVPDCEKAEVWRKLTSDWDECKIKFLNPEELRAEFNIKLASELTNNDIDELPTTDIETQWATFKTKKEKHLLQSFCDNRPYLVPADLLACLCEDRNFEPNSSQLAKEYKWGQFERKGLEEQWGLWLKSKHFETQNVLTGNLNTLFDEFQKVIEEDVKNDKLIKNSFYYVLKGNEHLENAHKKPPGPFTDRYRNEELNLAIECYDLAISRDPDFSLHAHYNKAYALFSFSSNKGNRQYNGFKELQEAKKIITDTFEPSLVAFHTLVAQTGARMLTAQHVHHQTDILRQQLNYIEKASEFVKGEGKGFDMCVKSVTVKKAMEVANEDHSKAVLEAATNGLTHLFTVAGAPPFPWIKLISGAYIGIVQLLAGSILLCCGLPFLSVNLGCAYIFEIVTSIQGPYKWARWSVLQAVSLSTSLMGAGWESVKKFGSGIEYTGSMGTAAHEVRRTMSNVLQTGAFQQCLSEAEKNIAMKNLLEGKRKEMSFLVKKVLSTNLSQSNLIKKALKVDRVNKTRDWERLFIYEATKVLNEEELRAREDILQHGLSIVADRIVNDEKTDENETLFFAALENYIKCFSEKFAEKVKTHKDHIKNAEEGNSDILVRYGKWDWVHVKQTIKKRSHKNYVKYNDTKNSDEYFETPIPLSEENEIPAVPVNKKDYYTSKANPMTHGIADIAYSPKTSLDTLTDLFTQRICQVLFLNMRYRSNTEQNAYAVYDIFREVDEANERLREIQKQKRLKDNFMPEVPNGSQHKQSNKGKHDKPISEINETLKSVIHSLDRDLCPNIAILEILALVLEAPILAFEGETGKLLHLMGEDKTGEPILLKITKPTQQYPEGAWEPLEQTPSEKTNGPQKFADVLESQTRLNRNLHGQIDVVELIKLWIHNNPSAATILFEKQNVLSKLF